jgi:hypothetical protein
VQLFATVQSLLNKLRITMPLKSHSLSLFFAGMLVALLSASGCTAVKEETAKRRPLMAEWQERQLVFRVSEDRTLVRTIRADRGSFMLLQEVPLPNGVLAQTLTLRADRHELLIGTQAGVWVMPIVADGTMAMTRRELVQVATARPEQAVNH